jgi:cellulose synthase/poly-beta-1,6-N-acetylglucosamine synthase-like glycosyltransferase
MGCHCGAQLIFWLGATALAFIFVGYGALMSLLARLFPRAEKITVGAPLPHVCAVVIAHNEEQRIVARIENLLASEYPAEKLRVLVVSDGSTDATVARTQALANPRVSLLAHGERRGKAAGLNTALAQCTSEIVAFADARQRFAPDAIARLAAHFADPQIGAASGTLEIDASGSAAGSGVDAYWRYEKSVRRAESRFDSCIGCTGAIYAIRRALFTPIPADTVLDDVVIPMRISVGGHRVTHDPAALAFDPQPLEPAAERIRKRRTLAGNFQMLFRHPGWLLPWRNRLWWQLISHKYLRLLAPICLIAVLCASILLSRHPFYRAALFAQCALYATALIGLAFPGLRMKIFALPAAFLFLNATVVRGFWHYLTSPDLHRWTRRQP